MDHQISTSATLRQLNAPASSSNKQATTAQAFQAARRPSRNKMTAARGTATGVDAEPDRYMQEVTYVATDNGLLFWQEREHSYPLLAPLAEDFVSAPALRHTLRVFSVCGDLCCRKRATKCLERCVFLKMNRKLVSA